MADNTKFVNSYVEIAVKQLHDNLNEILQYKTQIKILNDLVSEKDEVIGALTKEIETFKSTNQEIDRYRNNAVSWEKQYNEMKNKASHVDTLMNQVAEMTRMLQQKDSMIVDLEIQMANLKVPAPSINKRNGKTKKTETVVLPLEKPVTADDF